MDVSIAIVTIVVGNNQRVAADGCDEASWPDNDLGSEVCGRCKILVTKMDLYHRTCSNYCGLLGRECVGAWEEWDDTCAVRSVEDCKHDFGSYTSDAICECGSSTGKQQGNNNQTDLK